jgi:oxygen-independent coproporphyrinogen-3 oxidase
VQSRERLAGLGYREIALDHFALPSDAHWQATQAGTLHRNFMGFTTHATQPLLGLGVSAIGEAGDAYAQNEKELQPWQERVARGELPLHRGHMLDAEDRVLRQHILNIMTRFRTGWSSPAMQCDYLAEVPGRLVEMARDGLLELRADGLAVTEAGRPYLRNVCMAFDARLTRRSPNRELFSRTA